MVSRAPRLPPSRGSPTQRPAARHAAARHPAARHAATLAAAWLLAGCAGAPDPEPAGAPAAPIPGAPIPGALIPGASGLAVAGTELEIGFGRAQAGAIAAVTRLLGPPIGRAACGGETGEAEMGGGETGEGAVVRWPSGLALHFAQGALAGWEQGGRSAGQLCAPPS